MTGIHGSWVKVYIRLHGFVPYIFCTHRPPILCLCRGTGATILKTLPAKVILYKIWNYYNVKRSGVREKHVNKYDWRLVHILLIQPTPDYGLRTFFFMIFFWVPTCWLQIKVIIFFFWLDYIRLTVTRINVKTFGGLHCNFMKYKSNHKLGVIKLAPSFTLVLFKSKNNYCYFVVIRKILHFRDLLSATTYI